MKAFGRFLAILVLALAPGALGHADPRDRDSGRREEGRREDARRYDGGRADGRRESPPPRYEDRRQPPSSPRYEDRRGYGGAYPAYGDRAYGGYAPAPAPAPAYVPPPRYAPPPGYSPNSLGADWSPQQDQARRGVREGGLMALHNVTRMIGNRTPGHLLDAGLEPGPGGRPAYRVRWAAAGGRRIDFIVDAASGAILSRSGG